MPQESGTKTASEKSAKVFGTEQQMWIIIVGCVELKAVAEIYADTPLLLVKGD